MASTERVRSIFSHPLYRAPPHTTPRCYRSIYSVFQNSLALTGRIRKPRHCPVTYYVLPSSANVISRTDNETRFRTSSDDRS